LQSVESEEEDDQLPDPDSEGEEDQEEDQRPDLVSDSEGEEDSTEEIKHPSASASGMYSKPKNSYERFSNAFVKVSFLRGFFFLPLHVCLFPSFPFFLTLPLSFSCFRAVKN
jgi:hypothetical protein